MDLKNFELLISFASAAGTISAVLVALRLARNSDQWRDKRAVDLQLLHTVRLLPILNSYNENIEKLNVHLIFGMKPIATNQPDVSRLVTLAKEWSVAYANLPQSVSLNIESLASLPSMPALRISHAIGLLDAVSDEIARFDLEDLRLENGCNPFSKTMVISSLDDWQRALNKARRLLVTSIKILEEYASVENIIPGGDEI